MRIILFACCLFLFASANAQVAYIYIEGPRNIPFQVLVEGKQDLVQGTNYAILSFIETGVKNISIRGADGQFETQRFKILVQKNAVYGFQMVKSTESKYYLLDLVNEGKVIDEDAPATVTAYTEKNNLHTANFQPLKMLKSGQIVSPVKPAPKVVKQMKSVPEERFVTKPIKKNNDSLPVQVVQPIQKVVQPKVKKKDTIISEYQAIDSKVSDLQVNYEDTIKLNSGNVVQSLSETCARIAEPYELKGILTLMKDKTDDEEKTIFIKDEANDFCFSCEQLIEIGKNFSTQYGRYSFLKSLRTSVADPENYASMEILFKYEDYKAKFRKLFVD
ncbi:MAG: DUF4476 domain-containing protein [Bacteroidetes bacterium]|nr:DUF4476 domain-containing protein [Bacteroidota bacterium]